MSSRSVYINHACRISGDEVWYDGVHLKLPESGSQGNMLEGWYKTLQMNYPKFYKMDRMSQLALIAAELLAKEENLSEGHDAENMAVILSNSNASELSDKHFASTMRNLPSPSLFVYTLPNIVIGELCIRFGMKGENSFFVSPVFDAEETVFYVNLLHDTNRFTLCMSGWIEGNTEVAELFLYTTTTTKSGMAALHSYDNINEIYKKEWKNLSKI